MRKSEIETKILYTLLTAGAITLAFQHPANMRRFVRSLSKDLNEYKESQLRRALERLKNKNKIEFIKEKNNIIDIKITENGRNFIRKIDFDNLTLKKSNKWDKKWRVVIFDIPEKKKKARNALRKKLKDMDFKELQHSIWITPFPCEQEINIVKTIFNLSDNWIDVIVTDNLGVKDYKMKKYFKLI